MSAEVANKLREARRLIADKDKWFGGDAPRSMADDGRRCLALAVAMVTPVSTSEEIFGSLRDQAISSLRRSLDDFIGGHYDFTLIHYNDHHTHGEILALLDRAIADEEKAA